MKPEDLLDKDELNAVLNTDTTLIIPKSEEEQVDDKPIKSLPRCETCGHYELRDDVKGYCRNIEQSRMAWIEDLSAPPLTVTKLFGCVEHTDLKGK